MDSFRKLGLSEEALRVIKNKGFEAPTPIQEKVIPAILTTKSDIVGQAQTGTGKTAAFGLPLIELLQEKFQATQVLVLTPTRELAIQVAEEINSLKGNKKLNILAIYGGQSMELQLRALRRGVDIVVGTPGRILDHLRRRTLKLDKISYLILDEADEMLNMGFIDDVKEIMKNAGSEKRTLLFSATMPNEILQIAKDYMGPYELIRVSKGELTVSQTNQIYFEVSSADRFEALCRIIDMEEGFYGLIFCRTKIEVDAVGAHLIERGYDAEALHGDMSQFLREKTLGKFKKRLINILVATDVAARGIDVEALTHVINYSLPQDPELYVHRIGRTGRAGKEGTAITFITPSEYRKLQFIIRIAKTNIRKAKLPKVQDLIIAKRARIKAYLENIIKSVPSNEYIQLSGELLRDSDPLSVIAALLQYSFKNELDEKKYVQIEDTLVDAKGKTRLFVRQGRQDGLTPRKLIDFIKNKCRINSEQINDIQILDRFSFVTLPFAEAEIILSYFKTRQSGSGLYITKAKKR